MLFFPGKGIYIRVFSRRSKRKKEFGKSYELADWNVGRKTLDAITSREERRKSRISRDALIKGTSLIRIVRLKGNHGQDPFGEGFGRLAGREEADTSTRDTPLFFLLFLLILLSASQVLQTAVSTSLSTPLPPS